MGYVTTLENADDYYKRWHPRLSTSQGESLANIKKACDAIESFGPSNKMNPRAVGDYCQKTLDVAPAEMTIRNMVIKIDGVEEHVYRDYLQKRSAEYNGKRAKPMKGCKVPLAPSYGELANHIRDDDTRSWVLDLIQRWQHAENSYDYMAKQMEQMSRAVNGFDMAAAITEGPSAEDLSLPLMNPVQRSIGGLSDGLVSAIRAILMIPGNKELPFLFLNDRGALVWDSGTGPETLLSRSQYEALEKAIQGGD